MTPADRAVALAMSVARELQESGARGVMLTGSHAVGEAHARSDVDIVAVGEGESRLRLIDGLLISEGWITPADVAREFSDPGSVGCAVPGWRSAHVLADGSGDVAALKADAAAWTWAQLGDAPARWIAGEFPGYSEEVYRLVGHLEAGRWLPAAVMRNVLAHRMALILSVHLRILYRTENRLWELVNDAMGDEWRRAQDAALAIAPSSITDSCGAALDLFRITAVTVAAALRPDNQAVVESAARLAAEHAKPDPGQAVSCRRPPWW